MALLAESLRGINESMGTSMSLTNFKLQMAVTQLLKSPTAYPDSSEVFIWLYLRILSTLIWIFLTCVLVCLPFWIQFWCARLACFFACLFVCSLACSLCLCLFAFCPFACLRCRLLIALFAHLPSYLLVGLFGMLIASLWVWLLPFSFAWVLVANNLWLCLCLLDCEIVHFISVFVVVILIVCFLAGLLYLLSNVWCFVLCWVVFDCTWLLGWSMLKLGSWIPGLHDFATFDPFLIHAIGSVAWSGWRGVSWVVRVSGRVSVQVCA